MSNRTETPEYKKAAGNVMEEFNLLMLGRDENMNTADAFDLRTYAEARTDVNAEEKTLTDEQLVWKTIYAGVDSQLLEALGQEKKAEIDKMAADMRNAVYVQDALVKLMELIKAVEYLFVEQRGLLSVHFDQQDENAYKKKETELARIAVDEKTPPEIRIKAAKAIIELTDFYSKKVVKILLQKSEQIFAKLVELEKELVQWAALEDMYGDMSKWLALSKDLYQARAMQTISIERSVEADRFLPNKIIETGGDVGVLDKDQTTGFFNSLATYGALSKTGFEKEEGLSKERDALTKKIHPEMEKDIEKHFTGYKVE